MPRSRARAREFFQYLNERHVLTRLAGSYPLKRVKEEVPLWLYVASDISLRLHGMQSFNGYPLVVRTGGLIQALGPQVGRKVTHPDTGQVTLHCPGFKNKNTYERETPCDKDWLRKVAKATPADQLQQWYNIEVPRILKDEGMYDPEGIFIGDASYIFVSDNENHSLSENGKRRGNEH